MRLLSSLALLLSLLLVAPAGAQEAIIGSGVFGGVKAASTYTGPGDVVSGAKAFWAMRAYSAAVASGGTQKIINVRNTGTNETCDVLVASNGGLASTVSNCSGASSGTALSTFCSSCAITKWYDQSGANNCSSSPCDASQGTAANQPPLTLSCQNSLPCAHFLLSVPYLLSSGSNTVANPNSYNYVGDRTGGTTTQSFAFTCGNGGNPLYYTTSANTMIANFGTNNVSATVSDNTVHSIQAVSGSGSSGSLTVDGTTTSGNAGATGCTTSGWGIGAGTGASDPITGNIFEAAVYGIQFSGTNITNLCHNDRLYWALGGSC